MKACLIPRRTSCFLCFFFRFRFFSPVLLLLRFLLWLCIVSLNHRTEQDSEQKENATRDSLHTSRSAPLGKLQLQAACIERSHCRFSGALQVGLLCWSCAAQPSSLKPSGKPCYIATFSASTHLQTSAAAPFQCCPCTFASSLPL